VSFFVGSRFIMSSKSFVAFDKFKCERSAEKLGLVSGTFAMSQYVHRIKQEFEYFNSVVARATCHKMNNDYYGPAREPSYSDKKLAQSLLPTSPSQEQHELSFTPEASE